MVTRLRWRLTRLLAPVPVMAVPFEGDGAVILFRKDDWTAAWRIERLRIKSTTRLRSLDYDPTEPFAFPLSRTFTRFVGTVA